MCAKRPLEVNLSTRPSIYMSDTYDTHMFYFDSYFFFLRLLNYFSAQMRLTYHPHFMCSSFPQSFFNATLTFFRLVIHFSPFYFFSTSFLLLYNNILLKAALAWRTYFHPPEFLVAGPIPFFAVLHCSYYLHHISSSLRILSFIHLFR